MAKNMIVLPLFVKTRLRACLLGLSLMPDTSPCLRLGVELLWIRLNT